MTRREEAIRKLKVQEMSQGLQRSESHNLKREWLIKRKIWAKAILGHWPFVYDPLIQLWRLGKFHLLRFKWKLATTITQSLWQLDIHEKLWVSPQKIIYCALQEFSIYDFNGCIMAGDWDHLGKKFEDLDIYIAFQQVIYEGRNWANTSFYQRILYRLDHGDVLWGCENKNDLQERCLELETLYHTIREVGYRSQEELLQLSAENDPSRAEDEVTVGIGRHGDLLFCNSAHRLVIAKLLDVPQIPVKVAVYHPDWIDLRKELILYAEELGGRICQTITHPALKDIPAIHECDKQFLMVKENLTIRGGKLLDVCANIGYFCHCFEEEGFDCYAVEHGERELYFLRKLKRAENRKFSIVEASILDYPPIYEIQFDVVLMLNTLGHLLKTESDYVKLIKLLRRLKFREMFFEPCLPHEVQMIDAYRNYSPDQFAAFILENTGRKQAAIISEAISDGRPIYKIT